MADYTLPVRAEEFIFYVTLVSQVNTKIAQVNPTLAAGDVTVSKDGGAAASLATLPAVTPAGGKRVKVTVSASEMTADNVSIVCSDVAGAEWCDLQVDIQPAARGVDDLATQASVDTLDDFVDTEVVAIKAKTDNLPSDPADQSLIIAATDAVMARLGAPAGASVSADMAAVKAETASIQSDTNDLQTRVPAALVSGRMDSHVGSIVDGVLTAAKFAAGAFDAVWTVATRVLTAGTNIVLAKGVGVTGFNDLSAAQVNAEVVDVIDTDTSTEVVGAPAATSSIRARVAWLFKLARNKVTTTSTQQAVRNDADSVNDSTAPLADDGTTHTRGEWT